MSTEHEFVLWVVVLAAAVHVLEEYLLDWLTWANDTLGSRLGFHLTWPDFYMTNAALVVVAIAAAGIGWSSPEVSLAVPALFVVNAVGFHILPTVVGRRFSPGTISAVLVYLPVAAWAYWAADADGVLTTRAVVVSALGGVLLMAYPVILARLAGKLRPRAVP
jgi:hypothetical protein